jgi:hypothetical protein
VRVDLDERERERRLRLRFGPPVEEPAARDAPPVRRRRPSGCLVAAGAGAALLVAGAAAAWGLTPHDHVAPGCLWWTARQPGGVVAGSRGCVRGWYQSGGEISEAADASSYALPVAYADPDQPVRRPTCPFRRGDAVVVRYHAVFDDGRTIVVIEDCR